MCCVFFTPAYIFFNCTAEKYIFLKYDTYHFTKCFKVILPYINTVNKHTAACNIIKARNKVYKAWFTAACTAHNTDNLACFCFKRNIFKNIIALWFRVIFNFAFRFGRNKRFFRVNDINFGIKNFNHTLTASFTSCKLKKHHWNHYEVRKNLNNIRCKYWYLTYLHNTLIGWKCALIICEHDYSVKKEHHDRHYCYNKAWCHSTLLCKFIRRIMEFILFMLLTNKGFNHTHTDKVFLYNTVNIINLFLHFLKHRKTEFHNKSNNYYDNRQHNKKCCRHFRVNPYCHNCRHNQKCRSSYKNTKWHHNNILKHCNIICKSCCKWSGWEFINISKWKIAYFFIHIISEPVCKTLAYYCRSFHCAYTAAKTDTRKPKHTKAHF